MFDTQPKIVFMENFRWSKEALSQQNLQLWDLEPTSAPTPKANVELWDRLWSLFMCRFFLQVTLYSSIQIYTLWSTLKIFSNARENSERESHPGVHIYFPTPTITCKQNSWWLGWSSLNSISRDLQLCSHPKPWGAAIAPLVNMGPENTAVLAWKGESRCKVPPGFWMCPMFPVLMLSRLLRGTQALPATFGEGDLEVSLDAELEREQAPSKES